MAEILEYGIEQFGAKVAYDFYKTALNKVLALPAMPDIHPQSRFIESTGKKVYRNILVGKYAVLYSVTARTVRVITIYHQAINPERIKRFAK
jgi:plasmid stabilization system protein ParE